MSQNGAIKRFTYDFLVRLAETLPNGDEKFKLVSPLFTSLEKKYACETVNFSDLSLCQENFDEMIVKKSSKTMKIQGTISLCDFTAEGIQSKIIARQVCFDATKLVITDCQFTPSQLRNLLSGGRHNSCTIIRCTLTEPMNFSELWPYISTSGRLNLDINNLIVDETTGQNLFKRSNRSNLYDVTLTNVPADQDIARSVLSYFLSTENEVPDVNLNFGPDATTEWLRKTATALKDIEKIRSLGSAVRITTSEYELRGNTHRIIAFHGIVDFESTYYNFWGHHNLNTAFWLESG